MISPAAALLDRLADEPDNVDLRVEAARALSAEGRHAEAHDVLRERLENLVAHDWTSGASSRSSASIARAGAGVPCLCKRCIDPAAGEVIVDGLELSRDFVASHGRVLFFWVPSSLRDEAADVRAAVAKRLDSRLKKGKWVSNAASPFDDDGDDDDDGGDNDDSDEGDDE